MCNGTECWKSYKATRTAVAAGYTKVYWFRGGMPEWREKHMPVEGNAGAAMAKIAGAAKDGRARRRRRQPLSAGAATPRGLQLPRFSSTTRSACSLLSQRRPWMRWASRSTLPCSAPAVDRLAALTGREDADRHGDPSYRHGLVRQGRAGGRRSGLGAAALVFVVVVFVVAEDPALAAIEDPAQLGAVALAPEFAIALPVRIALDVDAALLARVSLRPC